MFNRGLDVIIIVFSKELQNYGVVYEKYILF